MKRVTPQEELDREGVFIGVNYETSLPVLGQIKAILEEMRITHRTALDKPCPPDRIHERAVHLLQSCGYAVFDVTDPAGQVMELQESLHNPLQKIYVCYGSAHTTAMILSLSETLRETRRGEIFQYKSSTALERFVKAVFVGHSTEKKGWQDKFRYLISDKGKTKKYREEDVLLFFPMGTLLGHVSAEDVQAISEFSGVKILITGWDRRSSEKILRRFRQQHPKLELERWYLVCEHCILYSLTKEGKVEQERVVKLYDEGALDSYYVMMLNRILVERILDDQEQQEKPLYFMSQPNEAGICYYINPPHEAYSELENYGLFSSEETNLEKFLTEAFGIYSESDPSSPVIKFSAQDRKARELLWYAIARGNGKVRPFLPYTLKFDEKSVTLQLFEKEKVESLDVDATFNFTKLRELKKGMLEEVAKEKYEYRRDYELFLKRIQPEVDSSIDIFCKAKPEVLQDILSKVIDRESEQGRPIDKLLGVYLSPDRETDIPTILEGYNLDCDFIAVGPKKLKPELENAGVMPMGEKLGDVVENVRDIIEG